MSIQKKFGRDFYFLPLGGSEQFGVNLNVYINDGDMLAIDCGIGFADERFPGIDLLLPDPTFLEEHQDDLKGMIITHAHEDHIGAVAHLWERFKCPLYGTQFTLAVLKRKLKEKGLKNVELNVIEPNKVISIGAFEVHPVHVSHSVPQSVSVFIKTKHGNVMHSGDWNLDPSPAIGNATDQAYIGDLAKDGVLAYIGDSTNAEVNGFSGSESDVAIGLEKEFRECERKIAITTFSSNIGRIHSIAKAAQACDRHVAVIGRSLHNMIGCAKECGYLHDVPDFIDDDNIGLIPDDKLVVIVTGSQGEYRAALAKVSRGDHPFLSLNPRDTVIFSSRAIPGNEREINQVKNNLSGAGIRIITPDDTTHKIHVSGHPCRDEIAKMFQLLKPKTVIPVHGERTQLEAHAKFAKSCQI
ncbi:MAG: ribonuclease J, partial [Bdellovibrionales bacterium]